MLILTSCAPVPIATTPPGTATAVEEATPLGTDQAADVTVVVSSAQGTGTTSTPNQPTVGVQVTQPGQLADSDLLVIAAIAALVGGVISYAFNVFDGLRTATDKIPGVFQPYFFLVIFIGGAIVFAELNCSNIFHSGVTCPATPVEWVKLVFFGLMAWGGSQYAHANGGKQLAAVARYKEGAKTAAAGASPTVYESFATEADAGTIPPPTTKAKG